MALDPVRGVKASLAAATRPVRGDGRGWTLAAVATGFLFVLGMRTAVPALLPYITEEFAISNTTAGFAMTLLWGVYSVMQFPAGMLTDRTSQRNILTASMILGGVGIAGFALAPVFSVFLAATAVFAFGTGLYVPPRDTLLSGIYPENDGSAFGISSAAGSTGGTVLPVVAGSLAAWFGWRAGFGFTLPFFLIGAVALWRFVPTSASIADEGGDEPIGELIRGIAAGLTVPRVLLSSAAMTLMVFINNGFLAFFPTYLVSVKGLAPSTAATLFGLFFGVGIFVQPFAGNLADRLSDRIVLAGFGGFGALTLAALPFVAGLWPLAVLSVLIGLRRGTFPINNAYIVGVLPDEVRGSGYGLLRSIYMSISATAPALVGALADAGWFDEAFLLLAALTAVATGLFLVLPPRS